MRLNRSCGVLAHPSSFPGDYGIGDFGSGAYEFVDFLAAAKQSVWQVLPLGPTSYGDSPYQSFSSFALNHYLLGPDELRKMGYLNKSDLEEKPEFDPRKIDYGEMIEYKTGLFGKAHAAFKLNALPSQKRRFVKFCKENAWWLEDYALFVSLKKFFLEERREQFEPVELVAYRETNSDAMTEDQLNDYFYGAVWNSWPKELASRNKAAVASKRAELAEEIELNKFLQFECARQWQGVKKYANAKGVSIVGDIPIFTAMDSSDVWANPELFCLDGRGRPISVAGVPPDYFSETGQLWGNPLYDWEAHKQTGYDWWAKRITATLANVDIIRIDHFRGFESFWAVPYGEKTAENGKWTKGPGRDFFNAIDEKLGHLPIIAEDLGVITEKVNKLRLSFGLPGMKVLQFAFGPDGSGAYIPHNFSDDNIVVYTGTHDNDTTSGWYEKADGEEKDYFRRYLNVSGEDAPWDMIRLAYGSVAKLAVVPIQDVMGLSGGDRMNLPGEPSGNWQFRYTSDMLERKFAERLAYLSVLFYRQPEADKLELIAANEKASETPKEKKDKA
ncbi:MAG: 4-alpha-glucanotransferase [Defluviitaleaceae bacterium]|nr:4-alpha-glucanotransferase [Defluviitaleaceae bacterium]